MQNWWTAIQKHIPIFVQHYYTEIFLPFKPLPATPRVALGVRTVWKFFRVEEPVLMTTGTYGYFLTVNPSNCQQQQT